MSLDSGKGRYREVPGIRSQCFPQRAAIRKWTIRIELTPDGNEPISCEIGTITRPIADMSSEQLGLTVEEGQQLLRGLQVEMIGNQARAYALCRCPCEGTQLLTQ